MAAVTKADLAAVHRQLGRKPRGVRGVAHRCTDCGEPDVVETAPRLPDTTPFPTFYYLTCRRLVAAVSTLEAEGRMREMQDQLKSPEIQDAYTRAHENYLQRRGAVEEVAEIAGVSAGGMPERVKCLHVLVAHALAEGPGVNLFGDEALAEIESRELMSSAVCRDLPSTESE